MATNKKTFESLIKEKLDSYELQYNHSDWLKLEKDMPSGHSGSSWSSSGSILKIAALVGITAITVVCIMYMINKNNPVEKSENHIIVKSKTNNTAITTQQNVVTNKSCDKNELGTNNISQENNVAQLEQNTITTKSTSDQNTVTVSNQNNNLSTDVKNANKSENNNTDIQNGNSRIPTVVMYTVDNTEGCAPFKVTFIPNLKDDSYDYLWDFGNGETSSLQKPVFIYENEGSYITKLNIKNKKTHQTSTFLLEQPIIVKPVPVTDFVYENNNNVITFTNRTVNTSKIKWTLGNGEESTDEIVKQSYKINGTYNVTLIATGFNGCIGSVTKEIKIDVFAHIFFPTIFTPDGDGRNDYFGPVAENLSDYQFEMAIYNRIGQLLFETKDTKAQWNGKIKGSEKLADPGVYAYVVLFKDKFGNSIKKTGSVSLIIK